MRLRIAIPIAFAGIVLIGVVVLIAVEVANYDGRTPEEVRKDERAAETASLSRCPKEPLGELYEAHDPGPEGETVPPDPDSALLCEWTLGAARDEKATYVVRERVLRNRAYLTELAGALDALRTPPPPEEGEVAGESCEEVPDQDLIGLRYEESAEVQIGIGEVDCYVEVLNIKQDVEFESSERLESLFARLLKHGY